MSSEEHATGSPNGAPAPGLPPVLPPSGRFMAQLFLVPGAIVLVAVLSVFLVSYIASSGKTPAYFLAKLDSDNADIRWHGASDLAQVLEKSVVLKTDVVFALELAKRLRAALDELHALEQKVITLSPGEQEKAWRKLQPQRDFVDFLVADLGHFDVPVGVPLLCEIINHENSPDVKGNTMRRRRTIWALANLGDHLKSLDRHLSAEQRTAMVAQLKAEKAGDDAQRAAWARTALYYLDKTTEAPDATGIVLVDRALAQCAKTQDRYLRVHVAMALNFWDGDLVEETLVGLTRDDGFGTLIRIQEGD